MGLPAAWLHVAEVIGVDPFLAMWRIVSEEPAFAGNGSGMLDLRIRPYRSYLRFQRNRHIETLHAEGKSLEEIQEIVRLSLCERISLRHIRRLVSGD